MHAWKYSSQLSYQPHLWFQWDHSPATADQHLVNPICPPWDTSQEHRVMRISQKLKMSNRIRPSVDLCVYTGNGWTPNKPHATDHHPLGPAIQPVFNITHCLPTQPIIHHLLSLQGFYGRHCQKASWSQGRKYPQFSHRSPSQSFHYRRFSGWSSITSSFSIYADCSQLPPCPSCAWKTSAGLTQKPGIKVMNVLRTRF